MKQLIVLVTILATLFCVNFCPAGAPTAPAGAEKSANAKLKKVYIAILAKPGPATEKIKKAENGIFVTELAKAFENRESFRVLDRDHITKVLREQSLSASGLVRQPLKAGRLFGAQYLIYSISEKVLDRQVISIICVEVSSGNVVFEKAVAVGRNATVDKLTATAGQAAGAIQGCILKSLAAIKLPSAAILYVENKSPSKRLDFLEHQLRSLMESMLKAGGYRILRRRYSGRLARETLLSTAGLVRPDATVLAEAADLAISVSFTESPSPNKAFKDTPITIVLKINRKGHKQKLSKLTFTLAGMKKLLPQLQESIFNSKHQPVESKAQQNLQRKIEAAELLATLTPLEYGHSLEMHRKQIKLAERVIYLDPTAKNAYFMLGSSLKMCIDKLNRPKSRLRPQTLDAYEKYLSFPRTDRKRVECAFRTWVWYWYLLNKDKPKKTMANLAEWVRWHHSVDPTHLPAASPHGGLEKWWDKHPAEKIAFYIWVDELYKWDVPCYPLKLADAYYKSGKYSQTARYLCEILTLPRKKHGHYLSYLRDSVKDDYKGKKRAIVLKHATPEQAKILRKFYKPKPPAKPYIPAMYGNAYGNVKDLYDYSYIADEIMLNKLRYRIVNATAVDLSPDNLQHSVIIRLTDAGLWIQGVTGEKLVLYLSPSPGKWKKIPLPSGMEKNQRTNYGGHYIISIVQIGGEVVFATSSCGLYVYDLRRKNWRHLGIKEGLPNKYIDGMVPDKNGAGAWIYGGRFLCCYRDGKIFGWKKPIPCDIKSMLVAKDRMYLLASFNWEKLVVLSQNHPKAKIVLSERQQKRQLPVPKFFGPPQSRSVSRFNNRRLVSQNGKMYLANEYGLLSMSMTAEAKPIHHWYPSGFYHWGELGGWVQGNCSLPPCCVEKVIPDDSNPNQLWVLSEHDVSRQPYKAITFITAYDTRENIFSKPIRINNTIVAHFQPRGEYIYLTGSKFSRLPKKMWVLDQPGRLKDTPLRVQCPDTIYGRASEALFHKDFDKAKKLLQEAIDAGIAVRQAKKMLKGIHRLQHPKKRKKRKKTKKTP
ncbi:MAG: CsgG/HfaB family protein [Phycisphaerae bacterium]|nr:CsgG/HfaB family protein [Phycisphaerae bacterium]